MWVGEGGRGRTAGRASPTLMTPSEGGGGPEEGRGTEDVGWKISATPVTHSRTVLYSP